MRVALGVRKFCDTGGQEQFSMRLAEHLAGRGHEVTVYTFHGRARPDMQIKVIPPPRFRPRYRRDWATAEALAAALMTADADVTFGEQKTWGAHVVRPGGGVEAGYWKYKSQRKWGAAAKWIAPLCPKRHYDLSAERRSLLNPQTRAIIANANLVKQSLCQHYPTITPKVHVVHNGVRIRPVNATEQQQMRDSFRAAHKISPNARVALFIGHDFHRKGLAAAIEALARSNQDSIGCNWHLLIAGRGNPLRYKRQARRANMQDNVHFSGCQNNCAALYAASDLLLLPTHYDPFANVTVEALGAGIPVITTARNGGSEIIKEGCNGWVVPDPTCTQQIARHMTTASHPNILQSLKEQASITAGCNRMEDRLSEVEAILTQVALELRQTATP